jgi:hypothetical protein
LSLIEAVKKAAGYRADSRHGLLDAHIAESDEIKLLGYVQRELLDVQNVRDRRVKREAVNFAAEGDAEKAYIAHGVSELDLLGDPIYLDLGLVVADRSTAHRMVVSMEI